MTHLSGNEDIEWLESYVVGMYHIQNFLEKSLGYPDPTPLAERRLIKERSVLISNIDKLVQQIKVLESKDLEGIK